MQRACACECVVNEPLSERHFPSHVCTAQHNAPSEHTSLTDFRYEIEFPIRRTVEPKAQASLASLRGAYLLIQPKSLSCRGDAPTASPPDGQSGEEWHSSLGVQPLGISILSLA